jgi:hypothetical protein
MPMGLLHWVEVLGWVRYTDFGRASNNPIQIEGTIVRIPADQEQQLDHEPRFHPEQFTWIIHSKTRWVSGGQEWRNCYSQQVQWEKANGAGCKWGDCICWEAQGKANKKKNDEKAGDKKEGEESKNYFADKECFICGKKGHGAKKCPQQAKKDATNDLSISSKSSTSA